MRVHMSLTRNLPQMTEAHAAALAKVPSPNSKQNNGETVVGYQIIIRDLNEEIARQTETTKKLQSENDHLRGEVDGMRTVSTMGSTGD
jgi:predicted RNase H-like nuclease (RuvC/YqgF family)